MNFLSKYKLSYGLLHCVELCGKYFIAIFDGQPHFPSIGSSIILSQGLLGGDQSLCTTRRSEPVAQETYTRMTVAVAVALSLSASGSTREGRGGREEVLYQQYVLP